MSMKYKLNAVLKHPGYNGGGGGGETTATTYTSSLPEYAKPDRKSTRLNSSH